MTDLLVNVATALGAAYLGVWSDRKLQEGQKNNQLLSTVASLSTGINAISSELTLIRQEMREDRKAVNDAVERIFERISIVEMRTAERFSQVEQRTSALEARADDHS